MQPKDSNDNVIIFSDYKLGSWLTMILLTSTLLIFPILILYTDLSNAQIWILIIISIIISIYISSYLFLNFSRFYEDRIEVAYFIKRASKKKVIDINNIIAFRYTYDGGRGSAGNGELKVYYSELGNNKILKCSLDKRSVKILLLKMKERGKKIEINPSDVLSEYGL